MDRAPRPGRRRRNLSSTETIGRCIVTSRDPDTGDVDLPTLITLAAYRREGVSEPLPLGIKGTVYAPGRVCLGDTARPL